MTKIKTINFIFCFLVSLSIFSQDTFSIIAADPETGEIGAAGATCVDGIATFGGIKILNKIIPGRGGVNAQAYICINPHSNLDLAITQMSNGLTPEEIIDHLIAFDICNSQNFNPEFRQYGIVDFDDNNNVRVAAFTGTQTDDYKGHLTGSNYSIQGNIVLGPEVLEGMEAGFNNTDGSLADKLMAAMQGANIPGADKRCLDRGTSSTSAFLKIVNSDDSANGHTLLLDVLEMPFGEEPIDSLQVLFDAYKLSSSSVEILENKNLVNIYPNPVTDNLTISLENLDDIVSLDLANLDGKKFQNIPFNSPVVNTDLSKLNAGTYLLIIEGKNRSYSKPIIKL